MRPRCLLVRVAVALLCGCDGGLPAPDLAGGPFTFTPAPCDRREVPPGREVACGTVQVPERWDSPGERRVSLRVAILRAAGAAPAADPVLWLDGPPGGSSVASALYHAGWAPEAPLRALLERREIVAVDLRGGGGSLPALGCPGVEVRALPPGAAGDAGFPAAAIRACRAEHAGAGVDLAAYGTRAAADDLEAVRRALGVERWSPVGVGYGARVALELLRRHPGGVRALVLDSVEPPGADVLAEQGPNLARAFERVIGSCERQPACGERYPDLRAALVEAFDRLEAEPADVATHGASVILTGRALIEALGRMLRDDASLPFVPRRLDEARRGELSYLAALLGAPRGRPSLGAHLGVTCAERMAHSSAGAIEERARSLPRPIAGALESRFYPLACALWGVPPAPATLRHPVTGAVPALVLAGAFDPAGAPSWTADVAAGLARATVLVLPRHAHAVTRTPCGAAVAAAFLDAPGPAPAPPACATGPDEIPFDLAR